MQENEENGKLLVDEPETGLKIFLKAQVVVSDVLDTQRLNAAIFYAIVTCTKHKLKQTNLVARTV